jgi:hypothetical protein
MIVTNATVTGNDFPNESYRTLSYSNGCPIGSGSSKEMRAETIGWTMWEHVDLTDEFYLES